MVKISHLQVVIFKLMNTQCLFGHRVIMVLISVFFHKPFFSCIMIVLKEHIIHSIDKDVSLVCTGSIYVILYRVTWLSKFEHVIAIHLYTC